MFEARAESRMFGLRLRDTVYRTTGSHMGSHVVRRRGILHKTELIQGLS